MSPRPILKPTKSGPVRQPVYLQPFCSPTHHVQPHSVHFPPSPALTRTFLVHSASTYDRSPIVVSQNDCALPERGCPGRTYFDESQPTSRMFCMGTTKAYHPNAFLKAALGSAYDSVPQLVPDLSSESDESDGLSSIPTPASSVTFGPHGLPTPSSSPYKTVSSPQTIGMGYDTCDQDAALAFLPYSPTSPAPMSYHYEDREEEDPLHNDKPRRRRERKHEGTVDPDRIPTSDAHITQFAHSLASLSISTTTTTRLVVGSPPRSPSTPKKKHHRSPVSPSHSPGFSNLHDDGCLGGF